jgi:hypothetical protein
MAENEELSAAWEEVSKGVDQNLRKLKKERQRVHDIAMCVCMFVSMYVCVCVCLCVHGRRSARVSIRRSANGWVNNIVIPVLQTDTL